MKKNTYVATVINYTTEQGKRITFTAHTTACSLKGLQARLKREMLNNTNWCGIESYTIHDRLYTMQEAKELRLTVY